MQIIIVGGGKTGAYLAPILKDDGSSVTVIESRKAAVQKFRAALPDLDIICGNGTSPDILQKAGILNPDVVIAATGSDEANLVVSTLSKVEYQVPRVVARVNNPKNAWMFNESMGVFIDQFFLYMERYQLAGSAQDDQRMLKEFQDYGCTVSPVTDEVYAQFAVAADAVIEQMKGDGTVDPAFIDEYVNAARAQ